MVLANGQRQTIPADSSKNFEKSFDNEIIRVNIHESDSVLTVN